MKIRNRLQRSLRHGRRFLTAMLLMTWTGCGCVQTPTVGSKTSVAETAAPALDVDPNTFLALNDSLVDGILRLRALGHFVAVDKEEQDALVETEEPFIRTLLRACVSNDEIDSLRLAIALYHLSQRKPTANDMGDATYAQNTATSSAGNAIPSVASAPTQPDNAIPSVASMPTQPDNAIPSVASAPTQSDNAIPSVASAPTTVGKEFPSDDALTELDYNAMAGRILRRLKAHDAPDSLSQILPDVLDYYLGLTELSRAASCHEEAEALNHALLASDAFSRAALDRLGAYYHRAREGEVKACIAARSTCQAAQAIQTFVATYPDYPELPDMKLWYAKIQLEQGKQEEAVSAFDDLIWDYPWSQAAVEAQKIVASHGFTLRERPLEETIEHVDFLRRKRFWSLAQISVDEALDRFPDSLRLMLQDARLSYEQSNYVPAIEKFQKLYDALDGEKRENIRPASVVAYIYRAEGYRGNCEEALRRQEENLTRLSRNDRIRSRMEYALTCGALDEVWKNAQNLRESGLIGDWDYGFYAYLAQHYEIARIALTQAMEAQSGTYKRRTKYFLAQATLKAYEQKIEREKQAAEEAERAKARLEACLEAHAEDADRETLCAKETAPNAEPVAAAPVDEPAPEPKPKKSRRSRKSKAKKAPALPVLAAASPSLARSLFEQLLKENDTDYYAILAYSRLAEMDGSPTRESSPLFMPLAGISTFDPSVEEAPARAIASVYAFDEETTLAKGDSAAWFDTWAKRYADVWPRLRRVAALHRAELYTARNRELRPMLLEAHAISKLNKRPTAKNLWYSSLSVDGHLVDNRRSDTGYWGIALSETYFHLPEKKATAEREKLAARQQAIFDDKSTVRKFIRDAAILSHDYYLARRYTGTPASQPGTPRDNDTWSIIYPHAYNRAIVEASRQNGLSPYLLWTLMNIESAFNPDSVSIADAYGLLQIIPITGYKLAEALQYEQFGPYDLIRPERSIPMGAWYFGQIVKKFGGYATLSMAGYNGGPFQVARWITAYGKQMEHDAFIELIPLNEARNYVKKGMARLLIFERIDHADPNYFYYISNSLPSTFEAMPNF